jgi:hypothetical protein
MELQAKAEDLWCGRHVKILDGSNVSMPDTAANQAVYPQHSNQAVGCGFPIAKLMVMFSLATGAAVGVLIDSFKTSEVVLARHIYDLLKPGDVALADRAFGSYVDLTWVKQQQADAVFRCHQRRQCDFQRGKRLGDDDQIVHWFKPKQGPKHMDSQAFAQLPDSIEVREVRFHIKQPGFRTQTVIVITTLLDAKASPKTKLAELYRLRWSVEVNLNHVKTTLKMEVLSGKTPEMVRKEIYVHLMAYNLLRSLLQQAAQTQAVSALRLSLQGARQPLRNFIPPLAQAHPKQGRSLYQILLQVVGQLLVPQRPNRYEPRVRKRRPKAFPLMKQPRSTLKAKLVGY